MNLSYGLSSILSSFYEDIIFISNSSSNIFFSGTNANLDFNILKFRKSNNDNISKVYILGCNVTNLSKLGYFNVVDGKSIRVD